MALSYKIHAATVTNGDVNGETRGYSFDFPSLSADHISVTVNGVAKTRTVDYTVENWTAPDGGNNPYIKFTTDAARGSGTIRIFRQTTDTTPSHDFQVGSAIKAADLNSCNKQNIYLAQENRDSINSLSLGSYQAATTIDSDNIVNFSIEGEDIQSNAITDVKVNTNAAIQGTKISPNFGNQNIVTTGTLGSDDITITGSFPALHLTDSGDNPDYSIKNLNGTLAITDNTNSAIKFQVNSSDGHVDLPSHVDIGGGTDVTGNVTVSGNLTVSGSTTLNNQHGALVPVGTVIWFAGPNNPSGYLKLNGDTIPNGVGTVHNQTADFSALYAMVGATLPDLRGQFIRGVNTSNSGVDSGRSLRSTQSDQWKNHQHVFGGDDMISSSGIGNFNSIGSSGNFNYDATSTASGNGRSMYTKNSPIDSGGTETRPRNVALLACIKY